MNRVKHNPQPAHARTWAYAGMTIAGAVSLAANVAHTYILTPNPPPGAVGFSILWPMLVFISTEIVIRTRLGKWRTALTITACAPIGAIAAVASYQHLSALLSAYGETWFVSTIGPVAIDGLMVLSTALLFATRTTERTAVQTETDRSITGPPVTRPPVTPDTEDDHDDTEPDCPQNTYPPITTLTPNRRKQLTRILTQVTPETARKLTWKQTGELAGITSRQSIKEIRALINTVPDLHRIIGSVY